MTYLIIGRGVAGISAAQEIRRLDPEGYIQLIGDEPYYYRGSLSEWLSGKTTEDMLPGRTPDFYRSLELDLVDWHIREINRGSNEVDLMDGRAFSFNRLLIATGAKARRFPIRGLDVNESLVFRSLDDVRSIREKAGCCGRVLILGGGVLGLELAGALAEMGGKQVAVVQLLSYMGAPLLDERSARWLEKRIRSSGVELFLEDTVEEVIGETAVMRSGKSWEFDLFIQAVGVSPFYPPTDGLDVGKGIRIDNCCRTNLDGVYAAGDCTETYREASDSWLPTRTWLEGARQGRTAGSNMVSPRSARLDTRPFYNASVLFDTLYSYIGEPNAPGGEEYWWETEAGVRKVYLREGKLAGALFLGVRHAAHAVLDAVGKDVPLHGDAIAAPDFPWNELGERSWTYHFY